MSYIEINNYTKKIKENIILDGINLNLDKGKIYGFVGINGSGKTMLFRAIAGLINPTSGELTVDGNKIGNGKHPQSIGLLIENANLWMNLSALENLKILNDMSKKQISVDEIKCLISKFGLDPISKKTFKTFSLGMKQKLRLAQAFMAEPELIILDEPTNALDEESVLNLRKTILEHKKSGTTFLLASHSKIEIEALCDEIIYMNSGKIVNQEKVVR